MLDRICRAIGVPIRVALVAAVIHQGSAYGQEASGERSLTLTDAIERAFDRNPGLVAAGFDIDIERAGRDAVDLRPPLSLNAELENFLGSGAVDGFDNAETTLELTRALELGGKRDRRVAIGDARIRRAETDRMLAELDLAADVASAFIAVVVLQEERELAGAAVEFASSTHELVSQQVEVGRSSAAELATAEIAVARAELEFEHSQSRLLAARHLLASLWGSEASDFDIADADLHALPPVTEIDSLLARVDRNPGLLRLIDESRVLDAERGLAEAEYRRDLMLGMGIRHLGAVDDSALVFSVGIPLGTRRRAEPRLLESGVRSNRLEVLAEQRRLEVLAALHGLHAEMSFAYRHSIQLRNELVPLGESAVELYRERFEIGSQSLLELSQAQNSLLALRRETVAAAAQYHQTRVDIERLLGGQFSEGVAP